MKKFHQLLAVGRWFPPGTPVSSTRKLISSFHRLDMTHIDHMMQLDVQSGLLAQQVVPVVGESRAIVVRQENPTISHNNEGPPGICPQTIARPSHNK